MLLHILCCFDSPGQEVFVMEVFCCTRVKAVSSWCVLSLCIWDRLCPRLDVRYEFLLEAYDPGLMPPLLDFLQKIEQTEQNVIKPLLNLCYRLTILECEETSIRVCDALVCLGLKPWRAPLRVCEKGLLKTEDKLCSVPEDHRHMSVNSPATDPTDPMTPPQNRWTEDQMKTGSVLIWKSTWGGKYTWGQRNITQPSSSD